MGILNLTPDSFSDGGRFQTPPEALRQAKHLVQRGAGMLDLGAESTRPGAAPITDAEEWARLEPALRVLKPLLPTVPLSLDSRHARVADQALAAGVSVINDVSGFSDPTLLALAKDRGAGLVAMRSRREGMGFFMPPYADPTPKTADACLGELIQVRDRLQGAGLGPDRCLLDPGFGFGTTFLEDAALWALLPDLPQVLDWPVDRFCLGLSRKRFLAYRAGRPDLPPDQRDALTQTAHDEAMAWGYRVFRTHAIPG